MNKYPNRVNTFWVKLLDSLAIELVEESEIKLLEEKDEQ